MCSSISYGQSKHITKINDSLYVAHFKWANILYISKGNGKKICSYQSLNGHIDYTLIDSLIKVGFWRKN